MWGFSRYTYDMDFKILRHLVLGFSHSQTWVSMLPARPPTCPSADELGLRNVIAWTCMTAFGTGSLVSFVFIDDVTADRSSRMNSRVYSSILCHILPKAAKLIRQGLTMQTVNDPKYTAKATQEFLGANKSDIFQQPSQWPDLNPKTFQ